MTSDPAIRREFRKYYVWLYSPKNAQRVPQLESTLADRPLSDLDRRRLEGSITVEETIQAIRSIGAGKSAGPDGLPAEVYKAHEKTAAPLLTQLYNQALVTGTLAFTLRAGDIILLYKKGDARDPRNYRPITLLQSDYKILAKILTNRLSKVIGKIISENQLGFVPRRLISEATHLLQLTRAYLDETGDPGLLLALDWEKAFDRVSWKFYHLALKLLNFGPTFQTLAKALTSEEARPIRTIKTNGGRSYPFTVGSGMPQGCPLSPLTFLLTTEALTRAINSDEDISGINLNGYSLKISQFADDTALTTRDYKSLQKSLQWVELYEKATGGKTNASKFQGLRMGSQRRRKPPWDMRKYNWINNDEYLTILGVPLGAPEALKPFWSKLAEELDARVAKLAPATNYMTIFGRASVVNFIIWYAEILVTNLGRS